MVRRKKNCDCNFLITLNTFGGGGGGGGSDLDSLLSNLSGQMSGVDESNPSGIHFVVYQKHILFYLLFVGVGRGKCSKCKQV